MYLFVCLPPCKSPCRYVYHSSQWMVAGNTDHSCISPRLYVHPDSPCAGETWMRQVISFDRVRLTNNEMDDKGHVGNPPEHGCCCFLTTDQTRHVYFLALFLILVYFNVLSYNRIFKKTKHIFYIFLCSPKNLKYTFYLLPVVLFLSIDALVVANNNGTKWCSASKYSTDLVASSFMEVRK